MVKQVKYVKIKATFWWAKVNEKHLNKVIDEYHLEGWTFEGVENHGTWLNTEWMAKFSR